jgi:hypothetical protein
MQTTVRFCPSDGNLFMGPVYTGSELLCATRSLPLVSSLVPGRHFSGALACVVPRVRMSFAVHRASAPLVHMHTTGPESITRTIYLPPVLGRVGLIRHRLWFNLNHMWSKFELSNEGHTFNNDWVGHQTLTNKVIGIHLSPTAYDFGLRAS